MPVSCLANASTLPIWKKNKSPNPHKADNMAFGILDPCSCTIVGEERSCQLERATIQIHVIGHQLEKVSSQPAIFIIYNILFYYFALSWEGTYHLNNCGSAQCSMVIYRWPAGQQSSGAYFDWLKPPAGWLVTPLFSLPPASEPMNLTISDTSYKWNHAVFDWLISRSILPSSFIHVFTCCWISFFLGLNNNPLHIILIYV